MFSPLNQLCKNILFIHTELLHSKTSYKVISVCIIDTGASPVATAGPTLILTGPYIIHKMFLKGVTLYDVFEWSNSVHVNKQDVFAYRMSSNGANYHRAQTNFCASYSYPTVMTITNKAWSIDKR